MRGGLTDVPDLWENGQDTLHSVGDARPDKRIPPVNSKRTERWTRTSTFSTSNRSSHALREGVLKMQSIRPKISRSGESKDGSEHIRDGNLGVLVFNL